MSRDKQNVRYIKWGLTLFVVGFVGILIPFISIGFARENNFIGQFSVANSPTELVASGSRTALPTTNPNQPSVKNRLIIPGAKIDMALIQSKSETALWRGGWVWPNDSTPDKGGNTVIFGHRFRYLPPITNTLYNLDKVKEGDSFSIIWSGKTYNYKVSKVMIINPTDVYILDASDKAQVTLVTCFPLFSSKQRLVVIGDLVSQ